MYRSGRFAEYFSSCAICVAKLQIAFAVFIAHYILAENAQPQSVCRKISTELLGGFFRKRTNFDFMYFQHNCLKFCCPWPKTENRKYAENVI